MSKETLDTILGVAAFIFTSCALPTLLIEYRANRILKKLEKEYFGRVLTKEEKNQEQYKNDKEYCEFLNTKLRFY